VTEPVSLGVQARLNPRGGRKRGPRWRRVLFGLTLGVTGLTLVLAATGYALYRHYNGQITRVAIRLPAPSGHASAASTPQAVTPADGSQNFLLMGSDSRAFTGGQVYNVAPGSAAYVTGQRSDVVMLLHIPAGGAQATVVSFPRDSWVTIPSYVDAKGVAHAAVPAKLNAAFSLGGAPLLVSTIESLTGLHIDHFASVNFPGFQGMVNAVGGLNVCVASTRHDTNSGDFLTAGLHHIDGVQALALVRDRESFPNQDLGRIKDQEYFLSVMLHKVLSAGTLTNPLKLNGFLNVATKSLTVDTGLSLGDMRTLASRFGHLGSADLTFETVPVASDNYQVTSSVYGNLKQSAVELDPAGSAQLFASLALASPTTSTPPSPGVPASASATGTPSPISAANLSCAP
jgi:LCP family protein required for cell wall assembly